MTDKAESLTKKQIRSRIRLKLKTQKEEDRNRKSRLIKEKLFRSLAFKKAKNVMFYISFGGEVETRDMIKEAHNLGKTVAVPVCAEKAIRPCILRMNSPLKKGKYCIPEPAIKNFLQPKDLDVAIVPAIAFDRKGNRLGRGLGYYDRFLKTLPESARSIGLAFSFQVLSRIPTTPTDVAVDRVIFA